MLPIAVVELELTISYSSATEYIFRLSLSRPNGYGRRLRPGAKKKKKAAALIHHSARRVLLFPFQPLVFEDNLS